uniref:DNA polymerase delta interacting protein 3 n=1 Tax=Cebus imitator TaxID=2715852 RepID=A0A2K5PE57_CEBIM
MVDISLDELIRKRGEVATGQLNVRPGVGAGIQQGLLSQSARTATFQQRFDARQKIGLADARLKLGVKDAQEKLLQKDAQFRIKGKVQDTRAMLNSRKQQTTVPQKPRQVADAQEISLKRSSRAAFRNPPIGIVTPALKLTKTIQVGLRAVPLLCLVSGSRSQASCPLPGGSRPHEWQGQDEAHCWEESVQALGLEAHAASAQRKFSEVHLSLELR